MHKSLVSIGGIGLGIDSVANTKIEHVCARWQQIKRQFLKSVADQPISLRSQHEFVVLRSGMHVDDCDCPGQGESVPNVGHRYCRRTKEGCIIRIYGAVRMPSLTSRRPRRASGRRFPGRLVQRREARGLHERRQRGLVRSFPRQGTRLSRQLRRALTQAQCANSGVGCRSRGLAEYAFVIDI